MAGQCWHAAASVAAPLAAMRRQQRATTPAHPAPATPCPGKQSRQRRPPTMPPSRPTSDTWTQTSCRQPSVWRSQQRTTSSHRSRCPVLQAGQHTAWPCFTSTAAHGSTTAEGPRLRLSTAALVLCCDWGAARVCRALVMTTTLLTSTCCLGLAHALILQNQGAAACQAGRVRQCCGQQADGLAGAGGA